MYLLGGNTTASVSLLPAINYVMWSDHLRSLRYTRWNPAEWIEIKSYYIIMRETLVHKCIYDSRQDIKCERIKGAREGNKLTLMLAAIAM